jgi:hypothetical protein
MAQVVECLPSKREALSSTTMKKEREKENHSKRLGTSGSHL